VPTAGRRSPIGQYIGAEAPDDDVEPVLETLLSPATQEEIHGAPRVGEPVDRKGDDVVAEHGADLLRRQVLPGGRGQAERLLEGVGADVQPEQVAQVGDPWVR